jgi:A/G-specific adenine glycosylase
LSLEEIGYILHLYILQNCVVPGIGDYIARALLCFVFDKPVSIVDTNVARLLYRFFGVEGKFPKNPSRKPQLINMASNLIPDVNVKEFNYAILDFCASVCTASNPDCKHCPLKDMCVYGRELEHFGFTSL